MQILTLLAPLRISLAPISETLMDAASAGASIAKESKGSGMSAHSEPDLLSALEEVE
jgi:hypothetical protein